MNPFGLLNQPQNMWFDPQKMDPSKVPLGLLNQPMPDAPAPMAMDAGPAPMQAPQQPPMQLPSAGGGAPAPQAQGGLLAGVDGFLNRLGNMYGAGGPGDGLVNLGIAVGSPGNMARNINQANEATNRSRLVNAQLGNQQNRAQSQMQAARLISEQRGIPFEQAMAVVQSGAGDNIISDMFKRPTPTSDQQNYQAYVSDEMKAGRAPQSFNDWRLQGKKASATTVNVGAGENKFDEELAKGQAKLFNDMAREAVDARADLSRIQTLRENLGKTQTGFPAGVQGLLSQYGINIGPEAGAVQAVNALLSQLVPAQRPPGSGPMSDKDVDLFRAALPRLTGTPEGNKIIMDTMESIARYKQSQGQIATAVMTGQMTRQAAAKALQELPDPFAVFRQADQRGGSAVAPAGLPPGWGMRIEGGN